MTQTLTARRSFAFALVLIGLLNLLGVSDCAKVENTVSGPEGAAITGGDDVRERCFDECREEFFPQRNREVFRHRQALRECDGDRSCIERENERHELAMREIRDDFEECKRICHEQGGGHGGQ